MIVTIYLAPQYLNILATSLQAATQLPVITLEQKLIFSFLLYSMLWIPCTTRLLMPTSSQSSLLILEVTSCTYYGKWAPKRVHIYSNHENEWHFYALFWML